MTSLKKKILLISLALILAVVGLLFYIKTNAAQIANKAIADQNILQGRLTMQKLDADMLGNVTFEELLWLDSNGQIVAKIPRGKVHLSLSDALSGNFSTTSITKIELNKAVLSLVFDENMRPTVINFPKDESDGSKPRAQAYQKNFNLQLVLQDTELALGYGKRLYKFAKVNTTVNIDTKKEFAIKFDTAQVSGNIKSGSIAVNGKINLLTPRPAYDFTLKVQDVIPASISPGIEVTDPLSLDAKVGGVSPAPLITGTFKMPRLTMEPLVLEQTQGEFRYHNAVLNITQSNATVYGGAVQLVGNINIDNDEFYFNIAGQGLDSTQATDAKISGPLDFTAVAQGNSANTLIAGGHFVIGKGSFASIPFKGMEGDFARENRKMYFSNIVVRTFAGDLNANLIQGDNGKVQVGMLTKDPAVLRNELQQGVESAGKNVLNAVKGLFK